MCCCGLVSFQIQRTETCLLFFLRRLYFASRLDGRKLYLFIYLLYSLSCCHFSAWFLSRLAFCCFVCWHFPPEALLDNMPIDGINKVHQISKCWLKQVFSKRRNFLFSCSHPQLSSDFYVNKVNLFDLCFCVCDRVGVFVMTVKLQ